VVDASGTTDEVAERVQAVLDEALDQHGMGAKGRHDA
jgi:hypothetical protein